MKTLFGIFACLFLFSQQSIIAQSVFSKDESFRSFNIGTRGVFQSHPSVDAGWDRALIGQNIRWNEPLKKWEINSNNISTSDFALLNFSNNGSISIFGRASIGTTSYHLTHQELDQYIRIFIRSNGNIGIGTKNASSKLTVAGNIDAREIKVTTTAGADFVFKEGYSLYDLTEVENFIHTNQHLPDIPSEKEMLNNGLYVGDFQIKLLQKIEELTLYLIEQNNINKVQSDKIRELEAEIRALKK